MTHDNRHHFSPARSIELSSVVGPALRVLVHELAIVVRPESILVTADFEVDGAEYFRCLDEGHLALDTPVRGEGTDPHREKPFHVTARLRFAIAERLRSAADAPMPALIEQLFTAPAPLAHTDAWRATAVTQKIDELGLTLGYGTVWAEDD